MKNLFQTLHLQITFLLQPQSICMFWSEGQDQFCIVVRAQISIKKFKFNILRLVIKLRLWRIVCKYKLQFIMFVFNQVWSRIIQSRHHYPFTWHCCNVNLCNEVYSFNRPCNNYVIRSQTKSWHDATFLVNITDFYPLQWFLGYFYFK